MFLNLAADSEDVVVLVPRRECLDELADQWGPDWSTSQYAAGAVGFFTGCIVVQVLLYYHLIPRNLAVVLVAAAMIVPPAIVGWWQKRKHGPFYNEPK